MDDDSNMARCFIFTLADSPSRTRKHVPQELKLDLFEQNAWIGCPFKVYRHRLRFLPPLPGMNTYLQLNVRTYVEYNGMKGIYFSFRCDELFPIKNHGNRELAISPFQHPSKTKRDHYSYTSHYKVSDERLRVTCTIGDKTNTNFDQWIVERYHSWAKWKDTLFRIDIHHSPWELKRATVTIQSNTLASFMKGASKACSLVHIMPKTKWREFFLQQLSVKWS